jgi:hypothetical protein
LPEVLMPWPETPLGLLTLGKLQTMPVPELENRLVGLMDAQVRRGGLSIMRLSSANAFFLYRF